MHRVRLFLEANNPDIAFKSFLENVQQGLVKMRARNITVTKNSVSFTAGMFRFVTNMNPLVSITSGEITVDPQNGVITYSLSFLELLVGVPILVGVLGILCISQNFPREFFQVGLPFIGLSLLVLNYLLGVSQFKAFIRRCMKAAGMSVVKRPKPPATWT